MQFWRLSKTRNFNFPMVAIFHFLSKCKFIYFPQNVQLEALFQQLHQLEFSKTWHFIWNLGMFVRRVSPFYFFGSVTILVKCQLKAITLANEGTMTFKLNGKSLQGRCVCACTRDPKTLFWSHVGFCWAWKLVCSLEY